MVDHRKEIFWNYFTGWFFIDLMSILPIDVLVVWFTQNNPNTSQSDVNEMMRITKFSKLYKIVKITRLFRLLKVMKNEGKIVKQIGS